MKEVALAVGPEGFRSYSFDREEPSKLTPSDVPASQVLVPGFVDLHIHGAFGIDTMSASSSDFMELGEKLEECGYEGFYPTTLTAPIEDVTAVFEKVPSHRAIWGVHLEGPFLSPKFPGAQPPEYIQAIPTSPSAWDSVLASPILRRVTLAPELPGALEIVQTLARRGIQVSMGHTNASYYEAEAAVAHGASHATHSFNAMRGFHHREAGMVGFVLSSPTLDAELIYDRFHVGKESARLLMQTRGADHLVAVSDCTLAAGLPDGPITMWGHECVIGDGTVRIAANGTLAGSSATLRDVFLNLWQDFGPEVAIRSCCLNPRRIDGNHRTPRIWMLFDLEGRETGRLTC